MNAPKLGIRWTIGDVRERGFVALRLSITGARRLFGADASYVVYVNSIPVERAREKTGAVPAEVRWQASPASAPEWLRARLGATMADGVAWKLLPVRSFPDRFELALDNDVVLWSEPPALRAWLKDGRRCLLAADVRPAFGAFSVECGARPLNTGIRGLPPGYDLEARLSAMLDRHPRRLDSELDEQGMQVAALLPDEPLVVSLADVTICSPFPPHLEELGTHGAHFVGINTQKLPFSLYDGRPSELVRAEHFDHHLPRVLERLGAS
ncbi:MAG TPA: hypothetical protein VII38_21355 [Polyangia bacterium]